MQEILSVISSLSFDLFIVFFFIMFYRSIKKCFLRSNKGKIKLFIMTLLTNPIIVFVGFFLAVLTFFVIMMLITLVNSNGALNSNDYQQLILDQISVEPSPEIKVWGLILFFVIVWFFYLIFLFIFSNLIGKWLKAYNKSLVTFVYIMFSIVMTCTVTIHNGVDINPLFQKSLNIIDTIIQFIALILMYHFDIKALSELTKEKREVNWKLFVIPPTILSFIRITLPVIQYSYTNVYLTVAFYTFSDMLLFLFIWAFYVIIQNINATNDAVNARNDAIKAKDEVKTLSVEVMEALAHTIDAKDEYTRGHSVRVAKYSRMLAEQMGLSSKDCEDVYYMGLLHDIGKIGVPNEIINSTTKLTDDEYAVVKTHPGLGYDILAEIKSRPDLSIGARWHHERFDGRGYPDGKMGEEIPLFARIISVADSYDAMTSNRSYRKYMSQDKVRAEIENNIGTQFDPEVAKCMLSIIDADKEYSLHE